MKDRYIQLIDKQIDKLNDPDFDLDAWKSSAMYLLKLLFGSEDERIREIEALKTDFSSWTLRDVHPNYKPIEACKKRGKEIFELAKDEIEVFGASAQRSNFQETLKQYFTSEEFEKLTSKKVSSEEKRKVLTKLKKEELLSLLLNQFI